MTFKQYGVNDGPIGIYFHGAPGAPEECGIFDQQGKRHGLTLLCFDRFHVNQSLKGRAYFKHLAAEISNIANGKQVVLIGFSIGAFVALQTSRFLSPDSVSSLHLVSAAAPLQAGNFMDSMAGKRVFQLAKAMPRVFVLLSYWQNVLAVVSPTLLFRHLFASAGGQDKALAADSGFQSSMITILRSCFVGRVPGYVRDVQEYVQPWESILSELSVTTHIWHGALDNWSPVEMANYLNAEIPGATSLTIFDGLSHYSCLYKALPVICQSVSGE